MVKGVSHHAPQNGHNKINIIIMGREARSWQRHSKREEEGRSLGGVIHRGWGGRAAALGRSMAPAWSQGDYLQEARRSMGCIYLLQVFLILTHEKKKFEKGRARRAEILKNN